MLDLKHQTAAQFVARFRERYRNSDKEGCAKLAYWLYSKYTAGDITATQIRNAFNLNQAQWDVFRVKVQTLADHWAAVMAAQGE